MTSFRLYVYRQIHKSPEWQAAILMNPTGNLTPGPSITRMDFKGSSGHALRNKHLKPDSNCRIGDGHHLIDSPRRMADDLLYEAVLVYALGFFLVDAKFSF